MKPINLKYDKIVRGIEVRGTKIDYYRSRFPLFHGVMLTIVVADHMPALHGLEMDDCNITVPPRAEARYSCNYDTGNCLILLKRDAHIRSIGHEAYHAVSFMGSVSGMFQDKSSEEAYCYAIGWVMEKIWDVAYPNKKG